MPLSMYECSFISATKFNLPKRCVSLILLGVGLCIGCADVTNCPCMDAVSPCSADVICRNTGSGTYICGDCPPGFEGPGDNCTDIDEVS